MKYTKAHEAAHAEFRKILANYYKGRITYREFCKAIFKAVGNHRYSEAWIELATIAMDARSVLDYETKVANHFSEIQYT